MDFSWEYICCRFWSTAKASDEEIFLYKETCSKQTFTREEVRTILKEHRKSIASEFDGPVTLINSKVIKDYICNSHEYEINLFPAILNPASNGDIKQRTEG
jgi:hypothetical protein